jgi:hypothetical protein
MCRLCVWQYSSCPLPSLLSFQQRELFFGEGELTLPAGLALSYMRSCCNAEVAIAGGAAADGTVTGGTAFAAAGAAVAAAAAW